MACLGTITSIVTILVERFDIRILIHQTPDATLEKKCYRLRTRDLTPTETYVPQSRINNFLKLIFKIF